LKGVLDDLFFGPVIVVFCWGFWENEAEKRGVLVVDLWWMCGETWCFVTTFLGRENLPRITDLFLAIPVLGIGVGSEMGMVRLSNGE
jgi:hypothetical protein